MGEIIMFTVKQKENANWAASTKINNRLVDVFRNTLLEKIQGKWSLYFPNDPQPEIIIEKENDLINVSMDNEKANDLLKECIDEVFKDSNGFVKELRKEVVKI